VKGNTGLYLMQSIEQNRVFVIIKVWPLKGPFVWCQDITRSLTSESVEGSSLSLESIDDIHGSDSLPLGMFSVGDSISYDVIQEDLEDSSGFFVNETRDSLDSSSTGQSSDGRLRDSLDVVSKNLSMSLGSSLSKTLSSFSSSGHGSCG